MKGYRQTVKEDERDRDKQIDRGTLAQAHKLVLGFKKARQSHGLATG